MLIEDIATGEGCLFACDWAIEVGQHVVMDGRRCVVVAGDDPRKGRQTGRPSAEALGPDHRF